MHGAVPGLLRAICDWWWLPGSIARADGRGSAAGSRLRGVWHHVGRGVAGRAASVLAVAWALLAGGLLPGALPLVAVAADVPGVKEPQRFVRYAAAGGPAWGELRAEQVQPISGPPWQAWQAVGSAVPAAGLVLLAPAEPTKVLAVGRNYRSHIDQLPPPERPEIFYKLPSALVGPGAAIVIPPGTADVHYEAELVLVIGRRAKNVSPEQALDYLFGVTCGNDVSARDWQKGDLQWWRAKASDTFAPCGPWLVTGVDCSDLLVTLRHNGQVRQQQSTKDLIHDVPHIISWISRHVTLEPGDLIYTGTPGKTAAIVPGDRVEVEIQSIGTLSNRVEAAPASN